MKKFFKASSLFVVIGIGVILFAYSGFNCKSENNSNTTPNTTSTTQTSTMTSQQTKQETPKKEGPSSNDIEREVMDIVTNISPNNYQYNASIFLNKNGVYKNLAVTNVKINSRKGIQKSERLADTDEEQMNLSISGIADAYDVTGFNQTRYVGRTNFLIDKEFRFLYKQDKKTKNYKWVGYIYDDMRDKQSLKFKKGYIR